MCGGFCIGEKMTREEKYIRLAILEAKKALIKDEVPIGCVIVKGDKVIARGYNLRETKQNVIKHAEIVALEKACKKLNQKFLDGCTLYVTLEPCLMCSGAIMQSRIKRVVYGAKEPKFGCLGSLGNVFEDYKFNHQVEVVSGVLEDESSKMMKDFFKEKRNK